VVAPIYLHLLTVLTTKKNEHVQVAAQNCSRYNNGAYTGEISAAQLEDLAVKWVIIGHSERRSHFKETNEDVREKVKLALAHKLSVIFCFGETLDQRKENKTKEIIEEQLAAIGEAVKDAESWDHVVLAYEPVWAIGTGVNAEDEQVR
jgi:triosephosphate isomerase